MPTDENTYRRVAYIEIALYTIIAIYFLQKFLIKYYVEDIKQNNLANSKSIGAVFTTSIAGGSPIDAFNNLVTDRFKSLFGSISGQFNKVFSSTGNIVEGQIKGLNTIRNFMKPIRDFITDATLFFYKKIETFIITIMYMFHRMRQLLRRSLSSFNLIFHSIENIRNLMISVMNSPITSFLYGSADTIAWVAGRLNKLCFDGHMPIKLKDGSIKFIKDIQCGDILFDDTIITSTLEFLNNEPLYSIHSNELDIDILVSGSHIVYDNKYNFWKTVNNYELSKKTDYIPPTLYCISTSNHKINIGGILFSDYEEISDNNEITYKLNHYILCGLNDNISAIDNNYFNKETKHMDSGLLKGTLIRMYDNSWKKIEDISIGDILYNKVEVIGNVKILAKEHEWYKLDNIISTDATKIYDDKLLIWHSINTYDRSEKYNNINDDIGYQLIVFSLKEPSIYIGNSNKMYKITDFIQIHDNKIQEQIEILGLKNMNKK
jgi:hypothetical protein